MPQVTARELVRFLKTQGFVEDRQAGSHLTLWHAERNLSVTIPMHTASECFIHLFSSETYQAFADSSRSISGFRLRHKTTAERVSRGDLLVCYLSRLSRWFGLLEVLEGPFIDHNPIFVPENDPFAVRFRVLAKVWLEYEKGIPIQV